MTALKTLAIGSLLTACVAAPTEEPQPAPADVVVLPTAEVAKPQTCAEIANTDPTASDQEYTLYLGGDETKPWTAYCADMASQPVEYLPLVFVLDGHNASTFVDVGPAGGPPTGVTTSFIRVRIDPESLVVDIGDQRYAGTVIEGAPSVQSMPYAVAGSCDGRASGRANVDLRGTEFTIATPFAPSFGTGSVSVDPTNQVVDLTGGGSCDWTGPASVEVAPVNGAHGWALQLAYKQ